MLKILFIRLSSIGDIVLTEPVLRLAKEFFPNAHLHFLVKPEYSEIVQSFGNVDKIHHYQDSLMTHKQLNNENFDYIIDLHNKLSTFIIMKLCKAKYKITYNKQHFMRRLIVAKLSKSKIDSVVWSYLDTLNHLPSETSIDWKKIKIEKKYYPRLNVNKDYFEQVKEIIEIYGINVTNKGLLPLISNENFIHTDPILYKSQILLGIFSGSQHFTKQCPLPKLTNFLLQIPKEWNCVFILLGDWSDKRSAIELKSLSGLKMHDLTGVFSLAQIISVISILDIVITNDSGPLHISAALNKPQIALYGATHTKLGFRPLNDKAVVLQSNVRCQPCSLHGSKRCKRDNQYCFRNITSEEIFLAFEKIYNQITDF